MKKFLVCLLLVAFSGCGQDGEDNAVKIRTENRLNMSKINVGMTKAEVLQIMGDKHTEAGFGKITVTVTNPYRSELQQIKGQNYEILYYYTHQDQKDWPGKQFKILERELTPVVFKDSKVIGWGQSYLEDLKNE